MTSLSTLDLVGRLEDLRVLLTRLTGELNQARDLFTAVLLDDFTRLSGLEPTDARTLRTGQRLVIPLPQASPTPKR